MTDPPRYSDTGSDTGVGPGRESTGIPVYPGTPRWLKVSGIVALLLVLSLVIMMFVGGGNHGPGRHMPSGGTDGHIASRTHTVQQL